MCTLIVLHCTVGPGTVWDSLRRSDEYRGKGSPVKAISIEESQGYTHLFMVYKKLHKNYKKILF
jgi:hypothetical protein